MPSPPDYSPDTVFFIGNGVLRVPSWIRVSTDDEAPHGDQPLPSWNQYMDTLWSLADRAREPSTIGFLGKNDFAKLSAPRQAEWFDRQISTAQAREAGLPASGLRLHLLGNTIHRQSGILTNDLIEMLARIILRPLWDDGGTPPEVLDVMTTNLDCSLEQKPGPGGREAGPSRQAPARAADRGDRRHGTVGDLAPRGCRRRAGHDPALEAPRLPARDRRLAARAQG